MFGISFSIMLMTISLFSIEVNVVSDTWDGTSETSWYTINTAATSFTINTAEELAGLAYLVDNGTDFSGKNN